MGGSSSRTRKITIDNENPTSVIKVTEECVQRIRGHQGQMVSRPNAPSTNVENSNLMGAPLFYEPSLTSIQLRQDNIKALKDNDEYWDKRITNLQKNHEEIKNIMEREYAKAMNEVAGKKTGEDTLKKLTTLPCGPNRARIIDCYKKHKSEPMRCAKEVQEFADCVDRSAVMIATK